ncbi:hypothetical protein [Actinokineospora inagensis]|uniref:hypothetical protein n=1 Tax=Actinokineospora inagensis TaxID=103730 RepID=UPI000406AC84|nr:hypothetical protein [Actinokineospora inagensis]
MIRRISTGERAGRLLLALVMLALATVIVLPSRAVAEAPPTAVDTPSKVTVQGAGAFSSLKFTVSQTKDLINQTVHLAWTGGTPTDSTRGKNYLQIMQCWGDDPTGPRRDQCQYGTPLGTYDSAAMWSRSISYTEQLHDPNEKLPQQTEKPGLATYVPFTPVSGDPTTSSEPGYGRYFDASTTNEVQQAVTQQNGTGQLDFEVQTTLEAPGLDCGRVRSSGADAGKARNCWLVVVPRGDTEVNGKKVGEPGGHYHNYLDTSPLQQSNWDNRLPPVRLDFLPVGEACALGRAERPLSGDEFIADAVLRWQPALCAGTGPVFGFVQMPDRQAREILVSDEPGMVFLARPADPATVPTGQPPVYAPVAVSAYTVAFIMERQPRVDAPPEVIANDGQPIGELNLNPRLIAKLLTQSYSDSVPGAQAYLKGNPTRLSNDPEFQALNPSFADYSFTMQTVDALASSVDMDATSTLWEYVNADADARAWLNGTADQWGMKVNKNFQGVSLPVTNFPKADQTCVDIKVNSVVAPICTGTRRPLAADMHEAGRSVNRGDSLGKEPNGQHDPNNPSLPAYQRVGRQVVGKRAMLAVVDTATAARYGLYTAKLRNAAGKFVAPTADSILAGVAEMTSTPVAGVRVTNTQAKADNAYPLPAVTYAATTPSMISKDLGKDFATFLRYTTNGGQQNGEGIGKLPLGYVPLPQAMREQAEATAKVIERDAGIKPPAPAETGGGTSTPGTSTGGSGGTNTGGALPGDAANPPAPQAVPAPGPAPAAGSAATAETKPVAQSKDTPSTPVGWVLRYLLAGLLVTGALATVGGPLLAQYGSRART